MFMIYDSVVFCSALRPSSIQISDMHFKSLSLYYNFKITNQFVFISITLYNAALREQAIIKIGFKQVQFENWRAREEKKTIQVQRSQNIGSDALLNVPFLFLLYVYLYLKDYSAYICIFTAGKNNYPTHQDVPW